jgi:myosin heavy subunit
MRYILFSAMVLMIAAGMMTSCSSDNASCKQCDSLRSVLDLYRKQDSMSSAMLYGLNAKLDSYGNVEDSIKSYRRSLDSLTTVIKSKGRATGAQNKELQDYMDRIRQLISQNQEMAESLKGSGYQSASMDRLIQLVFDNAEMRQQELVSTQREIAELKTKVKGLETQVVDLSTEKDNLTSTVKDLSSQIAQISGSVKVIQPKERKAKRIEKLDIVYTLNANDKADVSDVTVYFRIIDPNGKVLEPSGDFTFEGVSIAYTLKDNVEYDRSGVRRQLTWHKTATTLTPGTYTVDFFIDSHKGTSDNFTLDK